MNRKVQILIAGAGAAAGFYAMRSVLGKQINTLPYGYGIKFKKSVTINASAEQLYSFWRNLSSLTELFDNILSVEVLDGTRSHWTLKVPGGMTLEWDAEITVDRKDEMIGWRSLDGADLDNAGYVRFERPTGGRGTVVRVALQYNPPAGKVGAVVSTLLGEKPGSQVQEALRKLKQLMEAGEIPTTKNEEKFPPSIEPIATPPQNSFPP